MKYKGVIFDLDGTLVDSIEDIKDSLNVVMKLNDFPTHDLEAVKSFIGTGIIDLVTKALPLDKRTDELINKNLEQLLEVYGKNYLNKTKPYDGIAEVLDTLRAYGIRMSILSNKLEKLTKKTAEELLPAYFDEVKGLTTLELKKPNPAIALQICENQSIDPSEVIFIGDSAVDIQTAKNAGMYAVGVLWGFGSKEEMLNAGADRLLLHPSEIIRLIE